MSFAVRGNGNVKGKCALGPLISILVIECQHKCLSENICQLMDKVRIPLGPHLCFFNLILARRGMHVEMGMRKTVRGEGNGNDRTWNGSQEWEWALEGGGNEKNRTWNDRATFVFF
jgi:hypothetical protein